MLEILTSILPPPKEIVIFVSSFLAVFLLSFQSLVVNSGHMYLAMFNSFMIGTAQFFLFKHVPEVASVSEFLAFTLAGPIAVPLAIFTHRKWFRKTL